MIYDIITLVIFGLLIFIGIRRGAAKSLAGLFLSFVSYTAATFVGKLISVNFYNHVLSQTIHDTVSNTVSDFSQSSLQNALDQIDISSIDIFGIQDSLKSAVTNGLSEPINTISASAGQTAEAVVEPIVIGIMTFFITIFLFFLVYALLRRLILPLVLRVFRFPVIRQVDAVLGGVVGAVGAFLLVSMLAYLLKLMIPQVSTDVSWLNESTIYNSFIFKLFYNGNIFTMFASWLHI